jgi:alpha-ribazole phosphatase
MRLFLIRHGETEAKRDVFKGMTDFALSEKGIKQMEALAQVLPAIDAIFCSDLKRARDGAAIIGREKGLSPTVDPRLRERNFGIFEGLTPEQIRERVPGGFEAWLNDPVGYTPPGGESTRRMRRRVVLALRSVREEHLKRQDAKVAIVTHLGVIRIIIAEVLSMPLRHIFRIAHDLGAVSVVDFFEDFAQLRLLNYLPCFESSSTSLLNSL